MTESKLQVWVYLLIGGAILMCIASLYNYYVSGYNKAKAIVLSKKPPEERGDTTINMSKHIDETTYFLFIVLFFTVVSLVFLTENHIQVLEFLGPKWYLWILPVLFIWLTALTLVSLIFTGIMFAIQEWAKSSLQEQYSKLYEVSLVESTKFQDYYNTYR